MRSRPSDNAVPRDAGLPAPKDNALQIRNRGVMPTMLAILNNRLPVAQVVAWPTDEWEGFRR